ncbi:MAG: hypothetical protein QNJ30_07720 [Kiloniellales bacterium]|nr:hypothetical protein [Kiloniellales bacterium]
MNEPFEHTTATIHRRKVQYRVLVVVVALGVLGALAAAGVMGSARPLAGLLLLVPAWTGFLVLDGLAVGRWRTELLAAWVEGGLELRAFAQALGEVRVLPQSTLRGMFVGLPVPASPQDEARIPPRGRSALARLSDALRAAEAGRSLIPGLAASCVALSVVAAVWGLSWLPLAGAGLAVPLLVLHPFWDRVVRRRYRRGLRAAMEGLDDEGARTAVIAIAESLDWSRAPARLRDALLAELARPGQERRSRGAVAGSTVAGRT